MRWSLAAASLTLLIAATGCAPATESLARIRAERDAAQIRAAQDAVRQALFRSSASATDVAYGNQSDSVRGAKP